MSRLEYCPLIGTNCNKHEIEITFEKDTFFLAEPFKPEINRQRREQAIRSAVKEILKENYSESNLKFADREPTETAIFCDICQKIQSSEYGIVELSGLNPNVLLELGMMLALSKPVFVLMKKDEESDIKSKLPSDIIWKRAITYEDGMDIEIKLISSLANRPHVKAKAHSIGEINLKTPLEKYYSSIQKWYSQVGRKSISKNSFEQKKNMDAIITQYCRFMNMDPDAIIEDAKHEAMSLGGIVKSHDDKLGNFLRTIKSESRAFNCWGVLRGGFYGHNDVRLTLPRPKYTPEHSYEKLTTEQLKKMCDVGTYRSRSWILTNSYLGLDSIQLKHLKVEDFHTDKWCQTRKLYPVTIQKDVSGTFEYTTFIGFDAKTVLEEYIKALNLSQQDLIWGMIRQSFITEFERDRKRAGVGEIIDSGESVEDAVAPRKFASITAKALKKRLEDALKESIPHSNWNLIDFMLGQKTEGVKMNTPLNEEVENAYLQALPKLIVYDGQIPPVTHGILKPPFKKW